MVTTIDRLANMLDLLANDVLRSLEGVPEEMLNREIEVPEANSLFAIATHLLASSKVWTLVAIGGRDVPRDRDAEFVATGTLDELRGDYDAWLSAMHEVLDGMPDSELGRSTGYAPYRDDLLNHEPDIEAMTVVHALAHAIDHMAIHLGHIQVTRDTLLAPRG
jgi:uncharacterized damage-inducible protein DinB